MENHVTEFFKQKGFDLEAIFTGEDTSTVAKAAAVLGVEDGMIAKSLAFRLKDGTPIVLVVCGTGRTRDLVCSSSTARPVCSALRKHSRRPAIRWWGLSLCTSGRGQGLS